MKRELRTCPFHKGRAKTLYLPGDGTYHCLLCGAAGYLEEPQEPEGRAEADPRILAVNEAAAEIFTSNLNGKFGAEGREYLQKRGLDTKTIKAFELGYASGTVFPIRKYLQERGFNDDELLRSGLFKDNGDGELWFRFHERIIYPIRDEKETLIGFGGRLLKDGEPKYKNSPETGVFKKRENLYAFDKALKSGKNHLILCEGYMDVISMHQAGFTNAVASLGTALTDEQARKIRAFTDRVILLYDTDVPGQKATRRAIDVLKKTGIRPYIADSLPCKDPDEFIRTHGANAFQEKIKHPMSELDYLIRQAKDEHGENDYERIADILIGFA